MNLRVVFFVIALVLGAVVVLVEVGSGTVVGQDSAAVRFQEQASQVVSGTVPLDPATVKEPPGVGIRYLALVDGFLLFVLGLQGLSLLLSQRVSAKLQGIVTLVVSLLWVIASVLLALVALALLLLMIGLLLAVPFGTLAYLAEWGFFPVADSAAVLSLVLLLKLTWGGALVVANPRFLVVKGLVALFLVSLLMQVVLAFIQGLLPGVVVSIGDALWAIITAVVAGVWALVSLIGAIPAVVRAVRSTASIS